MRIAAASLLAAVLLAAPPMSASAQSSIRPLTLARLDQFIKGLEAEKAFWAPIWAKDKKTADSAYRAQEAMERPDPSDPTGFRKRQERFSGCQDSILAKDVEAAKFGQGIQAAMAKMTPDQQRAFATEAGGVAMNIEQAQSSGDNARLPALYDQMASMYAKHLGLNAAQTASTLKRVQTAVDRQCGRRPGRPTAAERDSAMNAAANATGPEPVTLVSDTLTSDVGMRVSGLGDNYALLRELLALYFSAGAESSPMTPDGFNSAERAVIRQRTAKLKPLLDFLDTRGGLDS
jgi:hypothetical protein